MAKVTSFASVNCMKEQQWYANWAPLGLQTLHFMAAQRQDRPNFLDAIYLLFKWQRIGTLLLKKLGRHKENTA